MADPAVVNCPKDTWVVVATAVKSGVIHKLNSEASRYLQTYRDTGGAAPTDDADAADVFVNCTSATISNTVDIDVYIKAVGKAGEVRVDL